MIFLTPSIYIFLFLECRQLIRYKHLIKVGTLITHLYTFIYFSIYFVIIITFYIIISQIFKSNLKVVGSHNNVALNLLRLSPLQDPQWRIYCSTVKKLKDDEILKWYGTIWNNNHNVIFLSFFLVAPYHLDN